MIDPKTIQPYIDKGLIRVQKHPEVDYWIYNYTQKAQFGREWDETIMMCRGLILDKNGKIIARPFPKFFNLGEHTGEDSKLDPIPNESFRSFEKFDGSLGILYLMPNKESRLATRGSFTSDQAIMGTRMLQEIVEKNDGLEFNFDKAATPLFEIIYPENRIVVNYGNEKKLVLLAEVGKVDGVIRIFQFHPFFEVAREATLKLGKIKQHENSEGYVIHFKSGLMVKVKFDEYVRLHRLITGVNKKTIWDLLRNYQPFDELIEGVPDEFHKWVKDTKRKLELEFAIIENHCKNQFVHLSMIKDRKEFALAAQKTKYPGILFKMLDKRDYKQFIWRIIKPKAELPFKEEI